MTVAAETVLEWRAADLGYDGRVVVAGLDLRVRAGEVVAVLGANGSGKSTTIRALFGLAQVLAGSIQVFGVDRGRTRDWYRIGYVPQAQTVTGAMPVTVREVVSSGRLSRLPPWRRFGPADRAAVARAVDAVGLGDRATTPLSQLSGGQQRRAVIARALAGEPEVLVLDEPTAGVDAQHQEALAAILAEECRTGLTVVLIAHELGPVAPLVTRVVVMDQGMVAFDGPPERAPADETGGDWHHLHHHPGRPTPPVGLLGGH